MERADDIVIQGLGTIQGREFKRIGKLLCDCMILGLGMAVV